MAAGVYALGAPFINRGCFRLLAKSEEEYSTATLDLVKNSTVIDMLGLVTLNFKKLAAWEANPQTFRDADFERLKTSGITVFHPAVGYTDGDIHAASLRDIVGWNSFIAAHEDKFLRIEAPGDLERAKAAGKIGIVIGQQNSAHFRTLEDVDQFYALGQRVSQLTYDDNKLGGGSTDPRNVGLSEYGAQIIERMNKLGMAVDVSHCADRTTLDAAQVSKKPVLVTHSNCRALVPGSARCKTDEAIRRIAASGGVLGVTMIRYFVKPASPVTIENVLDHIDHVVKVAGVEHVGLGTDVDLDGRDHGAVARKQDLDGVQYVKKVYDLTEGLVRRKYSKENIELILGGNFKRALSEIWSA